jgi:hypothetical protein
MFTCGLLRSNFSFAMFLCPLRQPVTNGCAVLQILERGTGFEPATITLEE